MSLPHATALLNSTPVLAGRQSERSALLAQSERQPRNVVRAIRHVGHRGASGWRSTDPAPESCSGPRACRPASP